MTFVFNNREYSAVQVAGPIIDGEDRLACRWDHERGELHHSDRIRPEALAAVIAHVTAQELMRILISGAASSAPVGRQSALAL